MNLIFGTRLQEGYIPMLVNHGKVGVSPLTMVSDGNIGKKIFSKARRRYSGCAC